MPADTESQIGAGFQAMAAGDWSGARDTFTAVLDMAEVPEALLGLANACYWLGDLAGVMESFERAYAASRRRPDPMLAAAAALSLVGYHKQFLGNMAAARGWLARAARIIETEVPQLRGELLGATSFVTDDPVELGMADAAVERAGALVELGAANDCHLIVAHGDRLLGRALATTDTEAACTHLESALAAFIRAEAPYRAAQTRLALATLLRETDAAVAASEARTSLTSFEDLGAGRDADAAAALLRELGVKAARTGPRNIGRLTKREQEVLGLLGEGLSNPEIAERLFLSRKTVEHHVAHVLAKLGLRGRAEAAAVAARMST